MAEASWDRGNVFASGRIVGTGDGSTGDPTLASAVPRLLRFLREFRDDAVFPYRCADVAVVTVIVVAVIVVGVGVIVVVVVDSGRSCAVVGSRQCHGRRAHMSFCACARARVCAWCNSEQIRRQYNTGQYFVEVDLSDLSNFDEAMHRAFMESPGDMYPLVCVCVNECGTA
jgi:hypothetical protein